MSRVSNGLNVPVTRCYIQLRPIIPSDSYDGSVIFFVMSNIAQLFHRFPVPETLVCAGGAGGFPMETRRLISGYRIHSGSHPANMNRLPSAW